MKLKQWLNDWLRRVKCDWISQKWRWLSCEERGRSASGAERTDT
jgi:hypothetical protein